MGAFSKFKELVGIEEIEDDEEEIEEEKEKKPLIPRQSSAPSCVSVRFERKTGTFWQQIYQRHEDGRHRTPGIR